MAIEPWTHQGEFSNSFVVVDEDDVVTNLEVVSYISLMLVLALSAEIASIW